MNFELTSPIYVGGFAIDVEDATKELTDRGLWGFFSLPLSKIQMRTDLTEQAQAQTLVHEVIHAIENVYLEGDELTERQVAALSQGLFQVSVDNPNFIDAIVEATSDACESESPSSTTES